MFQILDGRHLGLVPAQSRVLEGFDPLVENGLDLVVLVIVYLTVLQLVVEDQLAVSYDRLRDLVDLDLEGDLRKGYFDKLIEIVASQVTVPLRFLGNLLNDRLVCLHGLQLKFTLFQGLDVGGDDVIDGANVVEEGSCQEFSDDRPILPLEAEGNKLGIFNTTFEVVPRVKRLRDIVQIPVSGLRENDNSLFRALMILELLPIQPL